MVTLNFVLEDGREVVVPLSGLVTLGRDDDNDVIIDDERVSRHHAELSLLPDGRVELTDLGSTGGTFVNGRPVRKQVAKAGDRLAFGPLAASIIAIEDQPASAQVGGKALSRESIAAEEKRLAGLRSEFEEMQSAAAEAARALEALKKQRAEIEVAVARLSESRSLAESEAVKQKELAGAEAEKTRAIREGVQTEEKRLDDLRRQIADLEIQRAAVAADVEAKARQKEDELARLNGEATEARKTLDRLREEIAGSSEELAARSRQLAETHEQTSDAEAGARSLAEAMNRVRQAEDRLAEIGRERDEARACEKEARTHTQALEAALRLAQNAEAEVRGQLAARLKQNAPGQAASAQMELPAIDAEAARAELASLEGRLTPLRDWKSAMGRRHARLAEAAAGSAEERELNREIDEAYGALAELLPAARIEIAGLSRSDFTRMRAKSGVPMKSDRIRRA